MKRTIAIIAIIISAALSACSSDAKPTPSEPVAQEVIIDAGFDYSAYYTDTINGMLDKLRFGYEIISLNDEISEAAWRDFVNYMNESSGDFLIRVARKDVPQIYKSAHDKLTATSDMYQNILTQLRYLSADDKQGRQRVFAEIEQCIQYAGGDDAF